MSAKVSLNDLTSKQVQLIELLLAGVSIVTSAQQVGVAEKTAHKWLKLNYFQQAYKQAQQDLFDETLSELKSGMSDVIKSLKRHINADLEPTAASQVKAAQLWAEWASKQSVEQEGQSSYLDLRVFLDECAPEEREVVISIMKAVGARKKAEQEQPGPGALRMVK